MRATIKDWRHYHGKYIHRSTHRMGGPPCWMLFSEAARYACLPEHFNKYYFLDEIITRPGRQTYKERITVLSFVITWFIFTISPIYVLLMLCYFMFRYVPESRPCRPTPRCFARLRVDTVLWLVILVLLSKLDLADSGRSLFFCVPTQNCPGT